MVDREHTDRQGAPSQGYEVGYGKPPVKSQFKPGQSGNRNGRPTRESTTIGGIATKLLLEKKTVKLSGKETKMSVTEILINRLIDLASKGNMKAIKELFLMLEKGQDQNSKLPVDIRKMSDQQLYVFADRVRQQMRK
jgi:hypothetical protein